ncbi:hypothetical protein I5Q26_01235 [Serratia marcescens]|nr:hypothetical protein [Serratia marcescens]
MTVQVEALTYEALKAKCDHLEQINVQTLQVKLGMAETIKELTDQVNALAVENAALKEFIKKKCFVVPAGASCLAEADECAEGSMPETTATSAALAAIRNEATARALKHLCDCQLISSTVAELKATELREGK